MAQRHIVALWNPMYGPNVMEMHLDLLLEKVRRYRDGRLDEDSVYVWWGKVRSPSRRGPLPHFDDLLAIDTEDERDDPGPETHLYLTDFQSLYIAHAAEITADDPRADPDQRAHVPQYYVKEDLQCDLWFALWDVRRLIQDDTVLVARELRRLHNVRHYGLPVSIYGGMVELPLIVEESVPRRYFDPGERDRITDGKFWVEWDLERSGLGAMERELRENLFGDRAWEGLAPAARTFVATAEKIFREHRNDPAFDFAPVAVELSKALEVQVSVLLREALSGVPPKDRCVNVDGRAVDLTDGAAALSLGALSRAIEACRVALVTRFQDGGWFTGQLPAILDSMAELRNRAAHREKVGRDEAGRWRRQLLGVGCHGALVRLGELSA